MPIRFRCVACRQLLSIGRRKVGTEIQCPKCGRGQVVPSLEEAAAQLAADPPRYGPSSEPTPFGIFIFDEEPEEETWSSAPTPNAWRGTSSSSKTLTPAAKPAELFGGSASREAEFSPLREELRDEGIWISRRTLYLQGVLIGAVGFLGFALGYWLGWADSRSPENGNTPHSPEPVVVEGHLYYHPEPLLRKPDGGAVVIFLPADRTPKERFVAVGIRPQDPEENPSHPTVEKIIKFGGVYARTDSEGNFLVRLPQAGDYYVLLISGHARRTDSTIPASILQEMEKYFPDPRNLIQQADFSWKLQRIQMPMPPVEHGF